MSDIPKPRADPTHHVAEGFTFTHPLEIIFLVVLCFLFAFALSAAMGSGR